jgi:hypothetical protein
MIVTLYFRTPLGGFFLHHLCLYFCLLSEIYFIPDLDPFPLKQELRRNSLKMDVPEKILSQAHGKVRTVTDFLYENGE